MAGTIAADTLTHSTAGSIATNYVVDGSAKAWGFLEWSGGLSAEGSLNITSVSDDGNGDFAVNFASSFADAHYAYNTISTLVSGNTYVYGWELVKASGSANLQCGRHYNGGTTVAEDPTSNEIVVHGDLA